METKGSKFSNISLKKIPIPDKEWKEYKKSASQDEMYVLALGMKVWLAQTRIKYLIFSLCLLTTTILDIVLLVVGSSNQPSLSTVGLIILLFGYLMFGRLFMRRNGILTSYLDCKAKLSKGNAKEIKAIFKTSAGAVIVDICPSLYT